jgi:predicted dehydrogenase
MKRREFLKVSGGAAAGFWIAGRATAYGQERSPNAKLHVAAIGVGGQGGTNLAAVARTETIVALCDVDDQRLAEAARKHPGARIFHDYRRMFDAMAREIDAVVVSTPDHHHAPASISAMQLGKHVYCEKPLTHSVAEARRMAQEAARAKVATQMGNGGHSSSGQASLVELVRSGVIGPIREVHVWTDRAFGGGKRPREYPPCPAHLHWEEWLGPAPHRPYHGGLHPFSWRGWWDFGTGSLGDMACHNMDAAFWALELDNPKIIEAQGTPVDPESTPTWTTVAWDFPARGDRPPVKLVWYDGVRPGPDGQKVPNRPPQDLIGSEKMVPNGSIFVGEKGTIYVPSSYGGRHVLLPREKFEGHAPPPPTLRRAEGGHHGSWIAACKGGPPALSDFSYAARLTETVLLGNVAYRAGRRIEWDGAAMKPSAGEEFIRREYREGWRL